MSSKEYNEFCDKLLEIELAQKARRAEIERIREAAAAFIKDQMARHKEGR